MNTFKKIIFYFSIILFTICLIIFASSNISSTKSGLTLWATSIVPSLFPFFVATELLSKTNIPYIIGNIFKNMMRPIFNVGGEGAFALIMGFISGYPTGAKIACDFRKKNILPKEECERLLSFTNNSRSTLYNRNYRSNYVWKFYNWLSFTYISYFILSYRRFYF